MTFARPRLNTTYRNEFMDWIKEQENLSSWDGFRVYDIDSVLWRTSSNNWMVVETKTNLTTIDDLKPHHRKTLEVLHQSMKLNQSINYRGTWLITFQNLGPEDGYILLAQYNGSTWIKYYEKVDRLNSKQFSEFLYYLLQ